MEIILPAAHTEKKFLEYASQIQYDEFNAKMFTFHTLHSDVDVYQLMGDDRLLQLIYGWDACRLDTRERFTEDVIFIVKVLAHHTLQMWFSQEWITCADSLRRMLLHFVNRASVVFHKIQGLCDIDWHYLLQFQANPWRLPYLQQLFSKLLLNKHKIIEHIVPPATAEDIKFLRQERLHLIILRLVKLFDCGSWEAVKQLSLRVLVAWLSSSTAPSTSYERDQTSISLVAHLYLLTIFVADENRGYIIDNMMYNIRFYSQRMQEASKAEELTPARLIAQICFRLGLSRDGFFERVVFKNFNLSLITPFAVVLEAYTSYVLGNQLLEMMRQNEKDFMAHVEQFKVLMNCYVEEREHSEQFLLNELQKLESQKHSHAVPQTVNLNLNYQQQICKGNRPSNIGNYNCDDDRKPLLDEDEESDRQIDAVFQNIPNNEEVLEFVYKLLAKRSFKGWQFAKISLLLKIIGQKLNTIEIWRYHPGLTTDFMLNLEYKLSDNYADLAKVFSEHGFMEAEFWLTAFYLHPTRANYNEVKRCSRIKKKRQDDELNTRKSAANANKINPIKYELLSSTIDVDEIVAITNHNAPVADYDPIGKALQALRLPRNILNDLLTVAFQPRNKRYSWALEWGTLHERCSALLKSTDLKKKFVALNMAEANDNLKFLKIDYAKYKNRPQLDYGTIEEGYENAVIQTEAEVELSAEEDEEAIQQAAREKAEKERKRKRNGRKFWEEVLVVSEEEEEEEQASDESEAYYTGSGRRTRVRAAAVVASAMISDMDRSMRSGRRSPAAIAAILETAAEVAPKVSKLKTSEPTKPKPEQTIEQKHHTFGELLQSQAKYTNETTGFKAISDIWSYEKEKLKGIENNKNALMESNSLLNKFRSLQRLRQLTLGGATTVIKPEIEAARTSSRSNSEADSLHSGTSMMALHDANEFDEAQSVVSKEFTPPPASTSAEFAMETEVVQLKEKSPVRDTTIVKSEPIAGSATTSEVETITATEVGTDSERAEYLADVVTKKVEGEPPSERAEKLTDESMRSSSLNSYSSEAAWNARLKEECLSRHAQVRLDLLTSQDISKLRGVRVLVKRINFDDYYREKALEQKRVCRSHTKSQSHEESISVIISSDEQFKSIVNKTFVHITSDTPATSKRSHAVKLRSRPFKRFKHITSDSSTDHDEPVRSSNKRRKRGKKSKSKVAVGLKSTQIPLKIKPIKLQLKNIHVTADTDIIELSSDTMSSGSSPIPVPVTVTGFPSMVLPLELDPLYEEEVVPF